jgi:hypothetical protein
MICNGIGFDTASSFSEAFKRCGHLARANGARTAKHGSLRRGNGTHWGAGEEMLRPKIDYAARVIAVNNYTDSSRGGIDEALTSAFHPVSQT